MTTEFSDGGKIMLKSFVQIFAFCLWILPGLAHGQKLERAVLAYAVLGSA